MKHTHMEYAIRYGMVYTNIYINIYIHVDILYILHTNVFIYVYLNFHEYFACDVCVRMLQNSKICRIHL